MRRFFGIAALCTALGLAGCFEQQVKPNPPTVSGTPTTGSGTASTGGIRVTPPAPGQWKSIGTSAQGRPINAWSKGDGSEHVLYVGCIHGDEYASRQLLERLVQHLDSHPELMAGKRVVVIPVANPDGFAVGTRTNAHRVDLNRNFPTNNYRSGLDHGNSGSSEPETRALCLLIRQESPDVIVTLHSPLECMDYDGPAASLASRMSRQCGLPVKLVGARPGSLGSYAGVERQIPTVTVELPKTTSWATWDHMGPALLEALKGTSGRTVVQKSEADTNPRWRTVQAK